MFGNPLFWSMVLPTQMPQYVAQPSSEGPQPDVIGMRKGNPIYGPAKAFNPYMAVPAWASGASPGANQFANPLFNATAMPAAPVQVVAQPSAAAPAAKGGK